MQIKTRILPSLMTSSHCFICDKKSLNTQNAKQHYVGSEHCKNVQWLELNMFKGRATDKSSFHCYVCRLNFASETLLKAHSKEFPHNCLEKIKSFLVTRGISQEYAAMYKENYLYCFLCNVQLQRAPNAQQHFTSKYHKNQLSIWLNNLPPRKDIPSNESKWLFCNICDVDLDGTSNAEKHYDAHNVVKKRIFQSSQIEGSIGAGSLNLQPVNSQVKSTISHQETRQHHFSTILQNCLGKPTDDNIRSKSEENVSEKNRPILLKQSGECKEGSSNNQLKESVFEQLEKLVETLYYSKKVPYEISLEYLKRVNKEVGALIQNQKTSEPFKTHCEDVDPLKTPTINTCRNAFESVTAPNNSSPLLRDKEDDQCYSDNSEKNTSHTSAALETYTNNIKIISSTQSQSISSADKPKSISDLLAKIIVKKSEVEHENFSNQTETFTELQLLHEMEILLKEVDKDWSPLTEILKYLKKFNKELNELLLNKTSENETRAEDLKGDNFIPHNPVSEVPCRNDDSNLKLKYTTAELMTLRNYASHSICTTPDIMFVLHQIQLKRSTDDCASNHTNSIYKYYCGVDFASFMDFLPVYLQASTEYYQKTHLGISDKEEELSKMCEIISTDSNENDGLLAFDEKDSADNESVHCALTVDPHNCEDKINTLYDYYTASDLNDYLEFLEVYLQDSVENKMNERVESEISNGLMNNKAASRGFSLVENFRTREDDFLATTSREINCSCKNRSDNLKLKLVYSKGDLQKLRPFSSPRLCVSSDLALVLHQNQLWHSRGDNDTYSNTVYDYYSGMNFFKFMDFLDVYLQSSVEIINDVRFINILTNDCDELPNSRLES